MINAFSRTLGRIAPEKRPDRAVEIARRADVPLVIAAKVDNADRSYFEHSIKDLFRDPLVSLCDKVTDLRKDEFLGNARALLFPIDWPEPSGACPWSPRRRLRTSSRGVPVYMLRDEKSFEVTKCFGYFFGGAMSGVNVLA